MAQQPAAPSFDMGSLQEFIQRQAEVQDRLVAQVRELQGALAAVQGQQAIQEPAVLVPSFAAHKIKLDLPPKFSGKPSELTGWVFQVEQYCGMVGLVRPTDMVRLAVSRLEGDAFTWWRQLAHRGGDHELGTLEWSEFKSELVDAFVDVDRELKLRRKLASLRQQTSVANYVKQFRQTVLELGDQAPDDSALLFMFTEGLKADVQMQVLLARPRLLSEAEQLAERADMALFSSGKRQQQQQQLRQPQHVQQQPWQQRQQYRVVKPPPPPPRQGPVPMELGAIQGQQSHFQSQSTSARQVICYRCGKAGHMAKNCRVKLGGQSNQRTNFHWVQPQQPPPQYAQQVLQHIQAQPLQQQQPSQNFMHMQAQPQVWSQQQPQEHQSQLPPAPPLNQQRDKY